MEPYTIRFIEQESPSCCPACAAVQAARRGPCLFGAGQEQPLCLGCGRRLAPGLSALVELGQTAERVGKHCRHLLTPPMELLLDLARAAENYANAAPRLRAPAG